MRIANSLAAVLLAACMAPLSAQAEDPLDNYIRMDSPANEFHLFDQTSSEVLSFDSDQTLKICAGESNHVPALKVTHDSSTSRLEPGDCRTYTARNFTLSPAGNIDQGWTLSGTIQKG